MVGRFKILLRTICLTVAIVLATIASAQRVRPSTTVIDKDKYAGPTKWSCIDKHYGYYFISYSMPIPIEKNNAEIEGRSGKFRAGYMYRYKVAKPFDIGIQLDYLRQSTGLKYEIAGAIWPFYKSQKLSAIDHSIDCGAFMRFNFGKSDFRHLGWHIDIGADYCYHFAKITKTVCIYNNSSSYGKSKIKTRDKSGLYRHDYGVFMRVGWNYIALTCEYSFAEWDFNNYGRSPLMLGLQINMYTR